MNNPGVWPSVLYRDAEAGLRFLTGVLGFAETLTVRGEDGGPIEHGELLWPEGGGVMYGTQGGSHGGGRASGPQSFYVVTADPDAVYQRAAEADATITDKPHDTGYGSRNVGIADPEGNVWIFGTYPGAPAR